MTISYLLQTIVFYNSEKINWIIYISGSKRNAIYKAHQWLSSEFCIYSFIELVYYTMTTVHIVILEYDRIVWWVTDLINTYLLVVYWDSLVTMQLCLHVYTSPHSYQVLLKWSCLAVAHISQAHSSLSHEQGETWTKLALFPDSASC